MTSASSEALASDGPGGEAVGREPLPEWRFRRRVRPVAVVRELWQARALVRTLAERELRARYKQTFLGFAWAIITPITLLIVFSVFFTRAARIDTHGAPYSLFAYVGLLSWTFFSGSISQGGQSLISNMALLNKVYCPREVFPLGSVIVAAIDTLTAMTALIVLFIITGYAPKIQSVYVPLLVAVQFAFTLGVAFIVSVVTVYLRDLRQALPILLQLGLFATPVAYGIDIVPRSLQPVYAVFNPLAPVIDGYRRTVLLGLPPRWGLLGLASASALTVLCCGYLFFKRAETGIADVA